MVNGSACAAVAPRPVGKGEQRHVAGPYAEACCSSDDLPCCCFLSVARILAHARPRCEQRTRMESFSPQPGSRLELRVAPAVPWRTKKPDHDAWRPRAARRNRRSQPNIGETWDDQRSPIRAPRRAGPPRPLEGRRRRRRARRRRALARPQRVCPGRLQLAPVRGCAYRGPARQGPALGSAAEVRARVRRAHRHRRRLRAGAGAAGSARSR